VQDYLLDAPVSVGDGFSFSGGKKEMGGVWMCGKLFRSQAYTFCGSENFV